MENSFSICKNVKSKRDTKTRCKHIATHGDYCGHHHKHPQPWSLENTMDVEETSTKERKGPTLRSTTKATRIGSAKKIQLWFRRCIGPHLAKQRGPAYYVRNLCVNDADFFSTDPVSDISGVMFVSYKDTKNHVYGFDIRSIATLIQKATALNHVDNPFNRDPIPLFDVQRVLSIVQKLKRSGFPTEWAPLTPSTPIQQYRMKVVDVFALIDELNYYSSPDWFLSLNVHEHRKLYRELHSIWSHRANLLPEQKQRIVPGYAQVLFRHPPWAISQFPIERLQTMNLHTIRTLITSASDKNDRILGAMYAISALTLVHSGARSAYPWLYESVVGIMDYGNALFDDGYYGGLIMPNPTLAQHVGNIPGGVGWLTELLQLTVPNTMPPLLLNAPLGGLPIDVDDESDETAP